MGSPNPLAFAIAREARGHTQTALAKLAGVSQATISKIEGGQQEPSPEVTDGIAHALGFPREFFDQQVDFRHLPQSFYRKRVTGIAERTKKAVGAWHNIIRMQLRTLLSATNLPALNVPLLHLDEERMRPGDAAKRVRLGWHLPRGPLENLTAAVEAAGVMVLRVQLETRRVDGFSFFEQNGELPPVMFINTDLPADRYRFTLAHELGHVVMHTHLPLAESEARDVESEADAFASELLMPEGDIRGHLSGRITVARLAELKPFWKVAMAALLYRAQQLHRVTPHQARRLWMHLRGRFGVEEPNPIEQEQPSLLRQVLALHTGTLGYSPPQLAALLRTSVDDVDRLYGIRSTGGLRVVT